MHKKNEIVRLTVTDLNNLGFGVGHLDGMAVFIADAVDGDEADVRLIRVCKTYAVGKIERLITPSPSRIPSACDVRGCGGCAYRAIRYESELLKKENNVRFAFRKAGLGDVTVLPVTATGKTAHYRNKAQYAVAPDKEGKCAAGFYAPKSHRLCAAVGCPLQNEAFAPIVRDVLDFCNENGIPPYDEQTKRGVLRHIYLRASSDGRVMLTLVGTVAPFPKEKALLDHLRTRHGEIVGIYLNQNDADTNLICSSDYRHLWGETHLRDTLAGVRLAISPASFYQVNHDATELLYAKVAELGGFTGDETVVDLYSGVGSIALSLAHRVKKVIGVEIVAAATECAKQNARDNAIENATFLCADAGDAQALFDAVRQAEGKDFRPDAVVLDPPRAGCAESLLSYLCDNVCPAKILYVSCNPDTLARDARFLTDRGYALSDVYPFDLFPRTGHVESLVCLTRQTN
ncbi:MAG: 23S rRNA (uracil(1939)-C(5))-methyltransferase RlmD [Clostridia bacterium]|nr:23S rRNA (uracil(1939)-C(5))-methyltransferase RlmD [Clostridia bacterium]